MACRESQPTSNQFGVQRNRGVENFGHRTVLLGIACHSSKRSFVQVRHLGAQCESRPTDAESLAFWLKSNRCLRAELCWRIASALQLESQCHGEASGMGSSDQLFRIGPPLVLEAGPERIGSPREHPGIGGKVAAAGTARAAPNRFCLANHVPPPSN